jgi:hypothetical protein
MHLRAINHDLEHRREGRRVANRVGFMTSRRTISTRIAILTCLLLAGRASLAQGPGDRGGFGRGGFDRGNVDPEQMRRFQEMRERWMNGGGRGEGRDDDDRRGDDNRRGGGDFGRGMWGGQGGNWQDGNGGDRSQGDSRGASTAKVDRKPRPRYTVDLPELFDSVDSDQDGQVGLYEWRKSKRGLADFRKIDGDNDGFLTPAELVRANSIPAANASNIAAATPAAPAGDAPPGTGDGSERRGESTSVAAAPPPVIEVDASTPLAKEAKRMFILLDADRDDSVSESEWRRGVTLRPLFEKFGADLKQPMDSTTFVSHYVQIKTPKG